MNDFGEGLFGNNIPIRIRMLRIFDNNEGILVIFDNNIP